MNAATIRTLVVTALKAAQTDAGERVYSPRDWPTNSPDYPILLVQTPYDQKDSQGRNAPQFLSVTTVRITGRVEAFDTESASTGAMQAEMAVESLREQIDRAVINSYELTRQTQQYRQVRSTIDVDSTGGSHIGQLLYEIDIEYFQGPEDFYPIHTDQLLGIELTIKEPDGTVQPGFTADFSK